MRGYGSRWPGVLRIVTLALWCCAPLGDTANARAQGTQAGAGAIFPPVVEGRALAFPADTGAHPDFRTEWWYATGWLADDEGGERGFQVTFFRVRTGIGEDNPSRFAPRQLILAHAALADPAEGRLLHAERSARALEPLAGAGTGRTDARIDDWTLKLETGGADGTDRYRTRVRADAFAFDLELAAHSAPILNGRAGYSQKAPDPVNASYYYSRPQLAVTGEIELRGTRRAVRGHAWLDHEWSSELMPAGAQGWDWIGINLHDGGALMAFRMRDAAGQALWAGGTLGVETGEARILTPEEVRFQPARHWRSARTGAEYPIAWQLEIAGRQFELRALMDDQELDSRGSTGAVYWEGAVRLFEHGREVGQGYLEMTGYADRLRM
ncbi:MAG: carotenoid 1,2-hydratase [Rhodocyclaceae bacterium]|nr:carotenoid 1,2-hydratase [Rhodocyclaceae bacterium]